MVEVSQLPQYRLQVKNTFLEATIDNSSNDDDDLVFFNDDCLRRQVTDPPPQSASTMECMIDHKGVKKIDYTNGVNDVPKVSEPFEPELEPDLRPLAYAAMVRQVTAGNWSTWKARQWEPDVEFDIASKKTSTSSRSEPEVELDIASKKASTSSRSWADMTDDIHDAEWKPREKVAIDLSGALGMTAKTDLAPSANFDKMTVHANAASELSACTSGQQHPNVPEKLATKIKQEKQERRRKRESLIDVAARRLQKDQRQKKPQTHQNLGAHNVATKQLVPMFCTRCGGHRPQHYNFCKFCGAAASFNS